MENVPEAYIKLVEYERLSIANASNIPSEQEKRDSWTGVGFEIDGQRYAAPLSEIAEILTVPEFTTVPGVKSWVNGIANVRGRLMPIMDLMKFLNRVSQGPAYQNRLLVIEKGELYSALVVEKVLGMQHFYTDEFVKNVIEEHETTRKYIKGAFSHEGENWKIFSLFSLADDPEFLHAAI